MRKMSRRWVNFIGVLVAMCSFAATVPAFAWSWQATYWPFFHTQSFSGTVSGGQEDAAVVYESGERHAWAEGTYLSWTQANINSLVSGVYCRDYYCGGGSPIWYEAASTYHAFNKNTSNFNALHLKSGWAWSNLPGTSVESYYSGGEVRFYIGDPYSMSASTTYYSQMTYNDTAYNGTTKTNAQIVYSTYFVQVGSITPIPQYRDDNARLCIYNDTAVHPNSSGAC